MNCLKTSLIFALCVSVAISTPCSDTCNDACNLAKMQCDATILLGPVCPIAHGSCLQGCSNVCACVDGCTSACAPAKAVCDEKAINVLGKAQCVIENDVCIVDCQSICGLSKVAEVVRGLIQLGLGGSA